MNHEPRQFSNFDDVPGNNGWDGMSILDEPRYSKRIPEDDEEEIERENEEIEGWANFDEPIYPVTVVNREGNFNFQND